MVGWLFGRWERGKRVGLGECSIVGERDAVSGERGLPY